MADGDTRRATLDAVRDRAGAARARRRLHVARGRARRLHGLGFLDDDLDRPLVDVLGRRAHARARSPARSPATPTCCCSTSRPTTSTSSRSSGSRTHLQSLDAAVVLVAHDRWFLEAVGTAVLELEGGRARFFKGTWHAWRKEQAARELALGRAIEKQQAEIARLERFVDRFRAGDPGAPGAGAREEARQDRPDRARPARRQVASASPSSRPSAPGRVIFEIEDGTLTIGSRTLLEDVELWLERGEHVSLVGPNGAGKTTLIETLTGSHELARGQAAARATTSRSATSPSTRRSSGAKGARTVLEAAQRATGLTPNEARALLGQLPLQRRGGREAARRAVGRRAAAAVAGDPRAQRRERPHPRRADATTSTSRAARRSRTRCRRSPARCC